MDLTILNNLIEDAKNAYEDYPIMQRVVVTQGIHESHMNSPKGISRLALLANNLFGIKGTGDAGSVDMPTWESFEGNTVQITAKFAAFTSHEACFEAHRKLMEHPRYAPVLASDTVDEAFLQLRLCGYATDPNYSKRLSQVYTTIVSGAFKDE